MTGRHGISVLVYGKLCHDVQTFGEFLTALASPAFKCAIFHGMHVFGNATRNVGVSPCGIGWLFSFSVLAILTG